jgi:hypothetical protein
MGFVLAAIATALAAARTYIGLAFWFFYTIIEMAG